MKKVIKLISICEMLRDVIKVNCIGIEVYENDQLTTEKITEKVEELQKLYDSLNDFELNVMLKNYNNYNEYINNILEFY